MQGQSTEGSVQSAVMAAYAAGFFDGEGCVSRAVKRRGERVWPKISVAIVQVAQRRAVLDELCAYYGGNVYVHKRTRVNWSDKAVLQIAAQREVHRFLCDVMPYLRVKREEANNALLLLGEPRGRGGAHAGTVTATNRTKTFCVRGHPFDAENTYIDPQGRRCCRACGRVRWEQTKLAEGRIVNPRGPYRRETTNG